MVSKIKNMDSVKELFEGWDETIIWSCLQGIMGEIYAPHPNEAPHHGEKPRSAMAVLGDFCFFAGEANADLVKYRPPRCGTGVINVPQRLESGSMSPEAAAGRSDMIIMVPQNQQWAELIEDIYRDAARKTERYAIKKEADVFDRAHLKQVVESINRISQQDDVLRSIDETLYRQCKEQPWSRDLVSQFASYDMYSRYGLGFVILKDGEIISGASSYSAYRQGIEIEIDTREDYRRQGLAYVCGARLILECLDRGLYPSWDAQNKASVALAEKLGYHYSHTYTVYEIMV